MIFNDLDTTTKDMKDLQKKIHIRDNLNDQKKTDEKFRAVLIQLGKTIDAIEYLHCTMKVGFDKEIIVNTERILGALEKAIENGAAETEIVDTAENDYKSLQEEIKKAWSKQYNQLTKLTLATLDVIQGINPEKVSACIIKIQMAKTWDNNLNQLMDMKTAIDEAEELINGLGLDEEIKAFLNKVRNGNATLRDVFSADHKILDWIEKEKLDRKLYISLKAR